MTTLSPEQTLQDLANKLDRLNLDVAQVLTDNDRFKMELQTHSSCHTLPDQQLYIQ